MKNFENKLKKVPTTPGVYLMKDENRNIIYVGKAKNLRNRLRQYFQQSRKQLPKIEEMKIVLSDFEYLLTDTEVEALILENKLIKKYKPRYNALLKNYENYKYIKITNERFPRIIMEESLGVDGKYYGPFSRKHFVIETVERLRDIFYIRRCNKVLNTNNYIPCLNYHIKKCTGPCCGNISEKDYDKIIEEIVLLLEGKNDELLKANENKMIEASRKMEFEKAALYRDRSTMIRKISLKKRAVEFAMLDSDIIAFLIEDKDNIYLFYIRNSKILSKLCISNIKKENIYKKIKEFIHKHYSRLEKITISMEGIEKKDIDEAHIIERWLFRENGIYFKVEHIDSIEKTIEKATERIVKMLEQMNLC